MMHGAIPNLGSRGCSRHKRIRPGNLADPACGTGGFLVQTVEYLRPGRLTPTSKSRIAHTAAPICPVVTIPRNLDHAADLRRYAPRWQPPSSDQ
jgi:hypothetical protein